VKPEPFRIEPEFVERIWGMRSLAPLFREKTNLAEPIGEVWLTGVSCKVATGPFAGKTLGEAWREMPPEWRGTRIAEPGDFPLLIKFIFPNDKLSIQVHPDDAYAADHEKAAGGRGKTEIWHVVQAEPGAHVLIGAKPGISKQTFLDAIASKTLENLLEKHAVFNGDTFFVPAGTPHTIGTGMIICEVQEYSDLTYRVYDYGRVDAKGKPRELHIEKALEVIQFGKTSGGKVPPLSIHTSFRSHSKIRLAGNITLLSACRYFSVERWEFYESGSITDRHGLAFDIIVFLKGKGQIEWGGALGRGRESVNCGFVDFEPGQCWFIPANLMVVLRAKHHAAALRCNIPDLAELRSALKRERHSDAAIARAILE